MTTPQKDHSFFTFAVKERVYEEVENLSWVERQKDSRELGDGTKTLERLKVVGKNFVVGYKTETEEFHIREKFRFACEMLVAIESIMTEGGQLVREKWDSEA